MLLDHGTVGSRWKVQDLPWPEAQIMKIRWMGKLPSFWRKINRTPKNMGWNGIKWSQTQKVVSEKIVFLFTVEVLKVAIISEKSIRNMGWSWCSFLNKHRSYDAFVICARWSQRLFFSNFAKHRKTWEKQETPVSPHLNWSLIWILWPGRTSPKKRQSTTRIWPNLGV